MPKEKLPTVLASWLAFLLMAEMVHAEPNERFIALDGDTIELDGRVIDLAGIDAPEFGQHCRRGDVEVDCGMIARTQLLDLTAGSNVVCDLDDATIRTGWPAVAVCRAGGYDLSEGMLHTGWALADPMITVPTIYVDVQAASHDAGRGLWSFEFVEPWKWREGHRLGVDDKP